MIRAIFEDTRQKLGKHDNIKDYCQAHKIELIRQQLFVGDYTLIKDQSICIDTKKDLSELAMDLGNDKSRFMREVARAKKHGIKLIVLTEHGGSIKSIPDVAGWSNPIHNPHHPKHNPNALSGKTLMRRIYDIHIGYGTEFLFCSKSETGQRIIELLGGQRGDKDA